MFPFLSVARYFFKKPRTFLETRQPAAAVEELLLTAGPRRMRFRIDVEVQRIARLAPGRAGGEFGAVGHHDLDCVVIGMGIGFHGS